ncbi:hypothetical protein P152DRAFT_458494 [Eremomyces bilateralis CBS 781.70]|uniref:Tetraspanin n=1 Tax=Eremomyces bilateralis CBS 781.70 TaxID=1392243 RepID=A0A6G1G3Q2_9PEZI|nr:uncharacterized protein P152DRAFT_458494 [Eremomyces bilateralis CBS 781.70]KAF1812683.1 hypothetical protein P152DRAFT_458494 [Eremomyces bilateralis CBS 781.70]
MVNAILIFIVFLIGLPAMVMPSSTTWLRVHAGGIILCAIFTLILGLFIWFDTLTTRSKLEFIWGKETPQVQSLLQQRFNCCGYTNSTSPPFIQDSVCPNAFIAAQKQGCVADFSNFANGYLDIIFTAAFGLVALDALLVLCVACLVKWRREQERYRHIDEKVGFGGL